MTARTNLGPSLPKSLLEELDSSAGSGHKRKAGTQKLSRKELRKQGRHERKQRKVEFFSKPVKPDRANTKRVAGEHPETPQRKKTKLNTPQPPPEDPDPPARTSDSQQPKALVSKTTRKGTTPKSKTPLQKLAQRSEVRSNPQTKLRTVAAVPPSTRQEQEEDDYIAYLESKLGYTKGGKRTAKYGKDEDGLDDLLGDLDSFDVRAPSRLRVQVAVGTDVSAQDDEVEDFDGEDQTEGSGDGSEGGEHLDFEDAEEWNGFEDAAGDAASVRSEAVEITTSDIPASSETQVADSRYVPPHLRNQKVPSAQDSEDQMKLTRQLKGLLNRMSEQNIASIVDSIEEVYRNHRRHDVSSTLTTLIIDGISAHSILLDSYVVLHAAFVSSLHKLIGIEFAAYFVQNVITSYERHFPSVPKQEPASAPQPSDTAPREDELLGKECSNLIVLLSELYNFQVISCVLVYDLIRGLLDGALTEFKVELLLKITRNSGAQLRQDDPSALKSIIDIVHTKIPGQANALSSRTRFMVETLTNLKNNKLKRNAGPAPGGDAVERMKKFLAGLNKKRHVLAHEPLRVTLDDLHSAESKGKWWLVGAAWGGDPLVDAQAGQREPEPGAEAEAPGENVLLKLARKQGMNTDIRRGIFVVLMSSDDYVDACERLSQLKLTEIQQREIIRVLLHCCGNEKTFNPYYTLVAQQLCRTSHAHTVTLQFCLWDFLRGLGEAHVGGTEMLKDAGDAAAAFALTSVSSTRLRSVARAYAWWLAKDCCTLAVLKPVDFTVLQPQTRVFMKELLAQLFASTQRATPPLGADLPATRDRGLLEDVFVKAARIPALAGGLAYFIGEVFRGEARGEGADGFIKWASGVARDALRTGADAIAGLP